MAAALGRGGTVIVLGAENALLRVRDDRQDLQTTRKFY